MSLYTDIHQKEKKYQTVIPKQRDDGAKLRSPRACFVLPSTGLEPREVQEPWQYLTNHGFFIEFATWDGKPAKADSTLLSHFLFGSKYSLQERWKEFTTLHEWTRPYAWAPPRSSASSTVFNPSNGDNSESNSVQTEANSEPSTRTVSSDTSDKKDFSFESYDLVFICGGWASREHLEKDTVLQALLTKYCLNISRQMGSKVLAVVGNGISPLINVKNALTQAPLLAGLQSTGPGYDSWSGLVTGKDLGSLIPPLVKKYTNKKVVVDTENWYISSPASSYNDEFCPALVALVTGAVKVSEFRALARANQRLSTIQRNQMQSALDFDGLTPKQKERLNVDGIGSADSGFVLSNWSWGWRKEYT